MTIDETTETPFKPFISEEERNATALLEFLLSNITVDGKASPRNKSIWEAVMCFHDPKTHDFQLYNELVDYTHFGVIPIALIGVVVNIAALIFLHRPPRISSGVFIYLKVLLSLDLAQLVCSIFSMELPIICNNHHTKTHSLFEFCMYERRFSQNTLPRLQMTVNTLHIWTIAALSAHRYWKIHRPMASRMADTCSRARKTLGTLIVLGLIYRSPLFFHELKPSFKPTFKIMRDPTATERLSMYRVIYHSILDPLISNLLPFMLMTIFSLLTLYQIYYSSEFRQCKGFRNRIRARFSSSSRQPLTINHRQKAEHRQRSNERRATFSIVVMICLYLLLHANHIFMLTRKWQLLLQHQCPTRGDYILSVVSVILSNISATLNAFVFIAFTNRIRKMIKNLIRKTSRTLSSSSEPPLSPRTTITIEAANPAFL